MRLFETNENGVIGSPTSRNNEAKMPHCKTYNPMVGVTRPAHDVNCDSTPSGEYVVGRCWGACPSWVPVYFTGLSSGSLGRLKLFTLFPYIEY